MLDVRGGEIYKNGDDKIYLGKRQAKWEEISRVDMGGEGSVQFWS